MPPKTSQRLILPHSKTFLLTISPDIFGGKVCFDNSGELMATIFDFINPDVNLFFNGEHFYHKMEGKRVKKNVLNPGSSIVLFQLITVNFPTPLRSFHLLS